MSYLFIGIDPSFSRTGVAAVDNSVVTSVSFCAPKDNYKPDLMLKHSSSIAYQVFSWLKPVMEDAIKMKKSVIVGLEYPLMSSRSGSILAALLSKLDSKLMVLKRDYNCRILLIPPMAIASITKTRNKSKTVLVDLCKEETGLKLNHDEASAFFIAKIASRIIDGSYKNSYYER